MKITKEDYAKLEGFIDKAIREIGVTKVQEYRMLELGDDIEKRFRWDLFYASKCKLGDGVGMQGDIDLYAYLNDTHIDTALKSVVDSRKDIAICVTYNMETKGTTLK